MADHFRQSNISTPSTPTPRPGPDSTPPKSTSDIPPPFEKLDGLDRDDFVEAACEVFFTGCRSSSGFGGWSPITHYNFTEDEIGSGPRSPVKPPGVGMAVTSRVKRALGLKMMQRVPSSKRASSFGSNPNPSSPSGSVSSPRIAFTVVQAGKGKVRRPMTSAEIMRQQMRVTEQSDNRLRKTLMRTLVGQMGRRAETIILPLELLRHLKPSEFNDAHEYHLWQKRQLKILEAGLLLHPSIPFEETNTFALKLKDIVHASETKAIDTGKNSETMKTLVNCVVSLAWRNPDGESTDSPHWADGYPLNVHIYVSLLFSIFDRKDETLVLDEVDELLELMKKTWSTLGITRSMHNLCFAWVFFEQYVRTGQVEPNLIGASLSMLDEVANDAKKIDREPIYLKMLACVLTTMKKWIEERLLDYHSNYDKGTVGLMENVLPLAFSVKKTLQEDVPSCVIVPQEEGDDLARNMVDLCIRSSLRNEFAKMLEVYKIKATTKTEAQEVTELLNKLARETEELASKEKDIFTPVLKKWQPIAAGVAIVTLHACYGTLLKKYLTSTSSTINETVLVLLRAGKLEKVLVHMMVEESVEREDGSKEIVKEMVPYEVETIILKLLKQWIQERLLKGREYLQRAKEIETWNPRSKSEPYAQSAVELVRIAREAVDNFFEVPVNISENLPFDLVDGLEHLFQDYSAFVASCGSTSSYLSTLPPLTRCGSESKFLKLWKRAGCTVGVEDPKHDTRNDGNDPHRSTSRGTERLYIRINTLHYLLTQLHSLDKKVALSPNVTPTPKTQCGNKSQLGTSYFEHSLSAIQAACQHVSEVAAYRLIFLDSDSVFYGGLYIGDVTNARIWPTLRILKQNLTLLCALVTEQARPLILKEVMKASFQSCLMILLAGGSCRIFNWSDHHMIGEDFNNLKRLFCTCAEGLISEDVVERESDIVEGVVGLMSQSTEQLIEDFSTVAWEASGVGVLGAGQKLPMPPTTGKWNKSDPNTMLRVLCYRNDGAANRFLKRTFKLATRKGAESTCFM